jgi:hypothetical protein
MMRAVGVSTTSKRQWKWHRGETDSALERCQELLGKLRNRRSSEISLAVIAPRHGMVQNSGGMDAR